MNKLYTFLILSFAVVFGNAQIVNIPDANFKAKLLAANTNNTIASSQTPVYYPAVIGWSISTANVIDTNGDGEIQVSEAQAIKWLEVKTSNISNLTGIEAFSNLIYLDCSYNQLTSLNVAGLVNLNSLECRYNQLQNLLNVSACTNLIQLSCGDNRLTSLDVHNLPNLKNFFCSDNQLSTLDVTTLASLNNLSLNDNHLTSLFIKNNYGSWYSLMFDYNPITYICADEDDIPYVQNLINQYGRNLSCNLNSYCSFTPGGTYYTIQGNTRFDNNNNGCDASDLTIVNQKFTATNGTTSGSFISNTSGTYSIPVAAGTHIITPVLENPAYFNVSPTTASITFPTSASPFAQNFCITANGVHNDLEIAILPTNRARPGFNATYKILYKNKGTSPQSGSVGLVYDDAKIDLVSALPINTVAATNNLTWSFSNLQPFETREIIVVMNINSPTETPAVNSGDILNYTATIIGSSDENSNDNTATLNQSVTNSLDPNDKTCLEGTIVSPSAIGKYVHYIIRFENTGTANAENIVVKDLIDTSKYDINSLVALSGSASYITKVTTTNQVEFVFENINLPFAAGNNGGYVAFKIKTKPTLMVGNSFSNTANIYFDYNFPIITNTATTTISALSTQDFKFSSWYSLSPVPAKNLLTITTKQSVSITSLSIYNTLGQLVQVSTNPNETIDISVLKPGSYFIKIVSNKGTASSKFIKE